MKKLFKILILSLVLVLVFGTIASSAYVAYDTYTYSISGKQMLSPTAYSTNLAINSTDMGLSVPLVNATDIVTDELGNVYNINADTAAAYIAGAMKAERLLTMTDIEGILRDKNDHTSIIPCIDLADAKELFETGIISGGMIPKVECCIEAIEHGVKKVTILDGRVPHALLIETLTDEGAGTMVIRDKNNDN